MEKIIPLFNELQEILHKSNLNNSLQFPQLVVVGAQSTGKSSVLESIIGKDFLPRGTGIVTRRPIILQLNNTPKDSIEYAEFGHLRGEKFTDWDKVRGEIESETHKIAGKNKGISPVPIIVKVFSPNVVDLNIVDLPGITKIPVGDQPSDIEEKIKDIIMTYVKNPNTVILAVTSANTDLANSDSLKLARDIDPEGTRTIGIVTK
jgi:dynamin 1-like protein